MAFDLHLLEISPAGLAYICLGGFVVAFSTVSLLVKEKLYINEVILGTLFGIIVGPHCAGIFDPRSWGNSTDAITLEVMRVILATGLFAIGVELPGSYLAKHVKGLLILVVPTMAFGWVIVAAILHALFPDLAYISCLAIAACLTPTDPIICATIVGGKYALKHVPRNLRLIISAESAANDGLAYPFLSIAIYLTVESSTRAAIGKWFLVGWLYQVILGIVLGAFLGMGFAYVMKVSLKRGFIDRESYVAQYLALALFTIGVASTIGSDDLLAAFACGIFSAFSLILVLHADLQAGNAISWDEHFNDVTENEVFSSVIDLVLNCACFVYIGAWMPFDTFDSPELGITPWRLVVLFVAILALRRIPSVLLLYRWVPEIRTWREALFTGHFGPMGVGAVFVSTLALTRLPTPHSPPADQQELLAAALQPIVAFVVLGSIVIRAPTPLPCSVHTRIDRPPADGLSIPFFSLSGNMHSRTRSLMATLTQTNTADWLVGLRWGPAQAGAAAAGAAPDVERGAGAESRTATVVGFADGAAREEGVNAQQEEAPEKDRRQRMSEVEDVSPAAPMGLNMATGSAAEGRDPASKSPVSDEGHMLEMDIGTAAPVLAGQADIAAAQ
ncbi:Sodium/hydrogen exchanger family-domain-containing protein [Mycena rosella]|uniref:Sodium/hydrogen exchanger family-domain-containing protein n=1 Tax=Mycena rosella TaxID=1033263 RepID=A0AAD7G6V0_MYCRO|nr:Sodium/hydrogen exchanger family-domain-containing protein [Mycena rosella]